MSRITVRRVTAAAVLALALLFTGPGMAAAGSLEVAVPAFQSSSLFDRFLDWLGGLWGDQASTGKSILTTGGTNTGTPTGSTATTGSGPAGPGEQGAMIDPDG